MKDEVLKVRADIVHAGLALGIVASLTLNVMLLDSISANRLHLAEINGKLEVGVADRYRAQDARRDFEQIRGVISESVRSRDQRLTIIEQKLQNIEKRLHAIPE